MGVVDGVAADVLIGFDDEAPSLVTLATFPLLVWEDVAELCDDALHDPVGIWPCCRSGVTAQETAEYMMDEK